MPIMGHTLCAGLATETSVVTDEFHRNFATITNMIRSIRLNNSIVRNIQIATESGTFLSDAGLKGLQASKVSTLDGRTYGRMLLAKPMSKRV
jgi:hypothetical protein